LLWYAGYLAEGDSFARRGNKQSFGQAFSKACGVRGEALQHINKVLTFFR
jgi:hypothetical protein